MHDETALAEAEVEYENHTSSTVWVKYALLDDPAKLDAALAGKKLFTIIWTTTPWTLPASMAVAFHPDEEYVALESGGEVYIVASKLAKDAAEKCGLANPRELAHFPGRKLERLNFQHPFLDRKVLGVLADYVTMDTGTGVVHTAPSHGAEDFATGVKYGLDATSNVDEKGILRNGLPEYEGKRVWDANQPIIDLVKSRGALLHTEKTEHSYPHCWRCHNPVIFRATEQWFISMETPMPGGKVEGRRHAAHAHAQRDQERQMGSGVGRRAALEHDSNPARLVHLAPACVGRPDRRLSLRRLRQAAQRPRHQSQGRRAIRPLRRRCLVYFRVRHHSSRAEQSARIAAARSSKRKPTSSTFGWNRARAISR